MEIWRRTPLKKGGGVAFDKHALDNIKKRDYYQEVSRTFLDAIGAIGHVCMDNIRLTKRLPEKVVIEVELK